MWIKGLAKSILPKSIWNILGKLRQNSKVLLFYLFRIFPIKNNKIVLSNFYGKGFGDNPKYIALELLRQNEGYDLVWLVSDLNDESFPSGIRLVKVNSVKAVYEQVTARVWVDNCRKYGWVRKRKGQFYVQTWHGELAIKKIEKDAENTLSKSYLNSAKKDSKMTDLMLAGTQWTADLFKKSFWYDGEILVCGTPKIEKLTDDSPKIAGKIKECFGLSDGVHLAMYAPTFRNTDYYYKYCFDYAKIASALEKRFGGKWVIIKRYHPNVSEIERNEDDSAVDATHYPDMQELMIAAEILFTDYSSTMFETMYNPKKICFLYADDFSQYDRGFYFDLKKLPFSFAESMKDLEKNILDFEGKKYLEKVLEQKKRLGFLDKPNGSSKCAERIREVIYGNH